ncbi:MAG TPA: hypothetical protein VHX86_04385 [Tepidisphaeraceae bacterium]|jgi:hypothetical protein|nr:hypothetical protein [Tepidisphaeraceae bacterium]
MTDSDPTRHQQLERRFIAHVERLLTDDRLRLETADGRKHAITLIRDVNRIDRGVELKRLMSEMGKPDRQLESQMPVGQGIEVGLSRKKFWIFKSWVGRFRAVCISPSRALIAGQAPAPASAADLAQTLAAMPPPLTGIPSTVAIMSTSGFTPAALEAAPKMKDRTVILVWPNETGGWSVSAPPDAHDFVELFDPELDLEKRARIRAEIESNRVSLLSAGIATDKLAAKLQLSPQLVESELKSYAKENPGLSAKRLDGRWVLFQEGSAPLATGAATGGADMPFIDRVKTLFARKGEVEKKIAFLSERRAALSQQLDRGYEDMGALETKESEFRQQFKDAPSDLPRRRIAGQLLQLRKDIERRQQLLSVLNQQINVVSTHLHNLELQRQGKAANLPNSDELAADAEAAEEVLAELQAGSELAESVSPSLHGGMSAEEQALYDELLTETKQPAAPAAAKPEPTAAKPVAQPVKPPPLPQPKRSEPEPG